MTKPTQADKDLSGTRLNKIQAVRRVILVLLALVVLFLFIFGDPFWIGTETQLWIHMLGAWLVFACVIGRVWSSVYLGGRKNAVLMTIGPYSIIRNPLYFFSILGAAGIGCIAGSFLIMLVAGIGTFLVFNWVISKEEAHLEKMFGQAYIDYCQQVPRLIPRHFKMVQAETTLLVSLSALNRTLRESIPFFLAFPLAELINYAQNMGWIPILFRLF